jgi:tetratricopeptide (TPR) repeat protein
LLLQSAVVGLPQHAAAEASATTRAEAEARGAFARGKQAYDAGEFDAAAQAFQEAYGLSKRPGLLYNLYLAYRDANRQADAAEALRTYLALDPAVPNRPQLEARLKALDLGLAERKAATEQAAAAETAPSVDPVVAPVVEAPPSVAEANGPVQRPWLGPALVMGAGAALALGAVVPGVMAAGKAADLADGCAGSVCDASLSQVEHDRKVLALTSDLLLFGGIGVAAGGAAWLWFVRRTPAEVPAVTAACTARGCIAQLSSRF